MRSLFPRWFLAAGLLLLAAGRAAPEIDALRAGALRAEAERRGPAERARWLAWVRAEPERGVAYRLALLAGQVLLLAALGTALRRGADPSTGWLVLLAGTALLLVAAR